VGSLTACCSSSHIFIVYTSVLRRRVVEIARFSYFDHVTHLKITVALGDWSAFVSKPRFKIKVPIIAPSVEF
jgi:hypothetical protein